MTPVHCRVKHDPPNSYGDCMRACIATLLDIERPEDIPHFAEDNCSFEESIRRVREYLHPYNAFLVPAAASMQSSEIMKMMSEWNPNTYYLLCSGDHVVVCQNDKIVHDPAWYRTSLTQPVEAWVVIVITK